MEDVVAGVQKHRAQIPRPAEHRVSNRQTENRQRKIKSAGCDAETLRCRFTQEANAQSERTPHQVQQIVIFVHVRAAHHDQEAHQHEDPAKESARHPGTIRALSKRRKLWTVAANPAISVTSSALIAFRLNAFSLAGRIGEFDVEALRFRPVQVLR
jgi:hypothetical protein